MSLSTPCVALCQACVTAKQVWTTLEKQFDKQTGLAKFNLLGIAITTVIRHCYYLTTMANYLKNRTPTKALGMKTIWLHV